MATKLKDLQITSVDFVEQGANPEAYLCLFKGVEKEREGNMQETLWARLKEKVLENLNESLNECLPENWKGTLQEDGAETFQEHLKERFQTKLQENLQGNLQGIFQGDVEENAQVDGKKRKPKEEEEGNFFKSTDRLLLELERLESLNKGESVVKGVVPELRKVFEELEAVKKSQAEEILLLKKGMEVERLELFCKKFEKLGKDSKALAEHLYRLQGLGSEFYQEFVLVLEESLGFLEQSGLFEEKGVTGSGTGSEGVLTGHAKGVEGYSPDSLVQAWEKNPELAMQYESDYRKGRFV